MSAEQIRAEHPGLQAAVSELQGIIRSRFPEATFELSRGLDDAEAIHLIATIDVDNTDDVMGLVIDRMMEFQIDEGLPIFVIPVRPMERALEQLRSPAGRVREG
jgi:hypothetical protein